MNQASPSFTGLIEFTETFRPRGDIAHVVFDFDGTVSLIRQGWPEVMVPMFAEMLPRVEGDTEAGIEDMLYDDIMRLNGKQTIFQMMQFAGRVKERGGEPREPLWYKHEYLRRLEERIGGRKEALEAGGDPDAMLVHGVRAALESLQQRGWVLHLLSGTDQQFVREEAALLEVDHYFAGGIYGALDDYKAFSKKMAMERIVSEHSVRGEQLLSFGDGYVEIENTQELGGLAVAVASDEAGNGSGRFDEWKHQRLLGVGAGVVIPDYRDFEALLPVLTGEVPAPANAGTAANDNHP